MERIAIIDHANHRLFVETISDEDLEKYDGEEEKYIEDNYTFDGEWSWDYIMDAEYIPMDDKMPMDIDFETLEVYANELELY